MKAIDDQPRATRSNGRVAPDLHPAEPVVAGGRVALMHDFLLSMRGSERVFTALCDMFPDADLFTAVYDPAGTGHRYAHRTITTTPLQRIRPTARTFRALLPLYPWAVGRLDLSAYDLVISSSSAWAHGVRARADAVHLCYCHNPFRYAWNERDETLARCPAPARPVLAEILARWRDWDVRAAGRVDRYIANSSTTQQRLRDYFDREAAVVAPPVDTSRFTPLPPGEIGEHYVALSALLPHKRLDLAVRACSELSLPLRVIGTGPELRRLRRMAGPTVSFAGLLSDREVAAELARAAALIVTAAEEFGIAGVEAQAAGRPVLALRSGGQEQTVVEEQTGAFFDEPTVESLMAALQRFDPAAYDPAECVDNARRYDVTVFCRRMLEEIGTVARADLAELTA